METLRLLWETLLLRPYVFAFLGAALLCAAAEQGLVRALRFAGIVWGVAFLAEFASTRIGVPFGYYEYTGATRGQELYLSNVPVMDTPSFIFLAYGAAASDWARGWPYRSLYGPALVGLVLAFNVAVTAGIGAWRLLGVSSALAGSLALAAASRLWIVPSCARAHLAEPAVGQPGWEVRR